MCAESSRDKSGFRVVPPNIPNRGILYVDHQKSGRSGHGGNCLAECRNGDIISFYSNVSGEIDNGHGVAGWSEYRRSVDGGRTWGEAIELEYSKRSWEGDEMYSALTFGLTTAPNGALITFVCRFDKGLWVKKLPPVCILSYDNGMTWSKPRELDPAAGVEDVSLTFDAAFSHEGEVFVVFMSGAANYCPGPYSLYVSGDNGESFSKRSTLPFHHENYYVTGGVLDSGAVIVYSYPYRRNGEINEHDIDYVLSLDEGRTWSDVKTTHFAKKIRNPQMSVKIDDYYFMHGRSGSHGENAGNMVLYSSKDGINWDEGLVLYKTTRGGSDCYSANEVIGKYNSSTPNRLLIQSSIAYDRNSSRVNEHHWWVENIAGTACSEGKDESSE